MLQLKKSKNEETLNESNSDVSCYKAVSSSFLNLKSRVGFTLAEVLITLGIIGVVAAMTIPNLMSAYQKRVTVNRFGCSSRRMRIIYLK